MRYWFILCVAVAGCRTPPTVAPVYFAGTRGSLHVWASDSVSRAPIVALSGELRLGTRVTFAPVRAVADTLLFQHVPVGAYDVIIRRIGYEVRRIPVRISSIGNDSLHVVLRSHPSLIYDEFWSQAPWWKFWRR